MTLKEFVSCLPSEMPKRQRVMAATIITMQWPLNRRVIKHLPMTQENCHEIAEAVRGR